MEDQQGLKGDTAPKLTSETVSELARRHLKDPNHTTTEDELKNAKLNVIDGSSETYTKLVKLSEANNSTLFSDEKEDTEEKDASTNKWSNSKDGPDKNVLNPYDVLG